MPSRDDLVRDLVGQLHPVRGAASPTVLALGWLAAGWILVAVAMLLVGPFRPGAGGQLLGSLRFATETLFGLAAGVVATWVAFDAGIPGAAPHRRRMAFALGVLALWGSVYAVGLVAPALEPSMLGKRPHCLIEVVVFGLPAAVGALLMMRRLAPLDRGLVGFAVGAAAGAIPGLLMQLACMYDPSHILKFHIAPVGIVTLAAGALAPFVLRRI